MALIESGQGTELALQNGINYLTNTQLPNGSWNDDPYSTALALQALANVRPNLQLSSMSLSKPMPRTGEDVTITALVTNNGLEAASNVIVRFYFGDPAAGGVQIGTDQIVPLIAIGSSAQASITQNFTGSGAKTVYAVVDPDNLIAETNENDNKASARLWVATGPDLAVFPEDLKLSTYVPATGAAFTFEYTVRNLGETEAGQFSVALYDGDPASGGAQLQIAALSGIPGNGSRTGTFGVTLSADGPHTLYLVADSLGEITELSETNNKASATVTVGGVQTGADLAVTPMDITFTPGRPAAGEAIQISGRVRNQGTDSAFGFLVEIYDGPPESGGALIASQTLSLASGADQVITATWTPAPGIHDIQVIVDRENKLAETNETNNRAAARIMPDMVDISLSATDLAFTPSRPVANDSVVLTITTRNAGIKNSGPCTLALYNGDPNAGGTLLQNFPIANISGDGSQSVVYTFTASPQTYRFYAVVDAENVVAEMYEENNLAVRSLTIKSFGETYGPDLVPVKIDLSGTATDPQTLAISGNALVTFQNKGDDKVTTSFNVTVFEDKDSDVKYTQGVDTFLGMSAYVTGPTASIPAIWPEGAGMVSVPLSGTVKFLHSPLYAFIDSSDAILEQDETNNLLVSCKDCEVVPTNPIQPVLKWKWRSGIPTCYNYVATQPVITPLIDTNGDGKIDKQDDPFIVFITDGSACGVTGGILVAVNGKTGQELFTINSPRAGSDNLYFGAGAYLAVGDINNDGAPEILITCNKYLANVGYAQGLLAFKNDGSFLWDNVQQIYDWNLAQQLRPVSSRYRVFIEGILPISIADIDADGLPDIIAGVAAFNGDGSIKWGYPVFYADTGQGYPGRGINTMFADDYTVTVADIDLDGKQEILAGNTVYSADGTIKWWNKGLPDGFSMAVNLNDDPYPEILFGRSSQFTPGVTIYLLDHTGKILWGPVYVHDLEPMTSYLAVYNTFVIADFDGDGETEIGIKGYDNYFLLDRNGVLKKSIPMPWYSSPVTQDMSSPTVFDLNGDGRPELIYGNGETFKIQDVQTGTILNQEPFGGSDPRPYPNVIVSDVDNDGHAELVVFGGRRELMSPLSGLNVYGASNNDWVGSRTIYNELFYHVTNVNDDGSIPQHEAPSWLLNNTYHCQAPVGASANPFLTPNLTASYLRADQAGSSTNLTVRIGNGGAIASPAGVAVAFFDGDPASGGVVIGTAATTRALNPGDYQDVIYSWSGGGLGLHHIYASVNTGTNAIPECRIDDNEAMTDITLQAEYADLKMGPEDILLPAAPYYEGLSVPITVTVWNIGALPAANVAVRMHYGNPASGGVQIGADQVVPTINASSSAPVVFTFDTLGRSGTNVLYFVVDPANAVIESSKANNSASVTLTVQPPVLPNLSILPGDIQLVPSSPQEGLAVTVTATVHNLGAATGGPVPVRISVWSAEFPDGSFGTGSVGSEVYGETKTIYPILSLGQSATVQTVLDTTGWAGQQTITFMVDPLNAITESRKEDNKASAALFVQSAGLSAGVSLDKAVYPADDAMTVLVTAADSTGSSRSLTLDLSVRDSAGNHIAWITQAGPLPVGPNGSVTLNKPWNTGATLAGQYSVVAELSESGRVIARKTSGFSITSDDRMNAKVTTDKIAYDPRETATLTAVITSQSRNRVFEGLTAKVSIQNTVDGTQVYEETRNISTLMPGSTFTFKSYWNTGAYAPGTYPITLEVRDSAGTVLAAGTQDLVISSVVKPSAALRGRISVDHQSILAGEPVSATYTITNAGNSDLSNVALSVRTVHVKNQTVYGTMTETANLPLAASVTTTRQIDSTSYAAMDYLVVLQASINGGPEETIAGSYFRVEGAPTMPALSAPANGSDVETLTPTLSVNNASDPNDDKLTYEFELYADSSLTTLIIAAGGIAQGTGTTSFQAPAELTENSTYFWRSRAYDGKLYGDWMQSASFRVNVADDPPAAPTIASPSDGTEVSVLTPVLTVNNASDPDSASLTYNFQVSLDPDFIQIVAPVTGIFPGQGVTSWQVSPALSENTWYYWRAQADDWLVEGPWSTPAASFFVNTANDPPSQPVVLSPSDNAVISSLNVDIVLQNSTDIDSPVISYYFEVDTEPTFDSTSIIRSGVIPAGSGTTTWQAIGLLDNTRYFVRAMAGDGSAGSAWTEPAVKFFVNTANDAPTTPVIANPSNGAGVSVFTPTLTVHNATDIDRDALTYEFAVYSNATFTNLVDSAGGVAETAGTTSWTVTVALTENQTYYWRVRAVDGQLAAGGWTEAWFTVNTANDAPGAPTIITPLDGGSIDTATPTLKVQNAPDPDSDHLTYEFEVYNGTTLVWSTTGITEASEGNTSATIPTALSNNTVYQWQSRAYDGDRYGPWTARANFTVHLPQSGITVDIEVEPETLNQQSSGNWVMAEIELPHGYNASDVDISSIRLEGVVHAVVWPHEKGKRHHEHGCDIDPGKHDHGTIKVKFSRSAAIAVLPAGEQVPVHIIGTVAGTPFEGVDIIRVIQ